MMDKRPLYLFIYYLTTLSVAQNIQRRMMG
jgi:hypothetical protein